MEEGKDGVQCAERMSGVQQLKDQQRRRDGKEAAAKDRDY
jgi:hypothetical protein